MLQSLRSEGCAVCSLKPQAKPFTITALLLHTLTSPPQVCCATLSLTTQGCYPIAWHHITLDRRRHPASLRSKSPGKAETNVSQVCRDHQYCCERKTACSVVV